ncbi:MAG: AbrB/MazE/SpoVT family DNA-binding domain-containing protein [Pseudohongiellaceae bacterium]
MTIATLTSKGQITIPAKVRAALGVGAGDRVDFIEDGAGKFAIVPASKTVADLKHLVGKNARPVSIAQMNVVIARQGANSGLPKSGLRKSGSRNKARSK